VAWAALAGHFEAHGRGLDLREAFARDPRASRRCPSRRREVFADLSKNLLDAATLRLLVELAQACGLPARRDAMLAGEPVNATEGRAVLHTALRAPRGAGLHGVEVHAVLDAMLAFAEEVRDTATSGITDVVNIGIGGSDLGPQMAVAALDACAHRGIRLHFVSNVDAHDIVPVLRGLDARRTLFIVASKTFTTQETMANARAARDLVRCAGRHRPSRATSSAVTTNLQAAAEFGITAHLRLLGLGRRPLLAVDARSACRSGDRHRRRGLPRLAGWRARHGPAFPPRRRWRPTCRCCWACSTSGTATSTALPAAASRPTTRACAGCRPTCSSSRWRSNGKRVDARRTQPLPYATSPVVLGRARHQRPARLLPDAAPGQRRDPGGVHRGARTPATAWPSTTHKLLANVPGAGQALMLGKTAAREARRADAGRGAGAPPHLPGQPAQHHAAAAGAHAALRWAR
jgi:glucose-6-phosphate isomerase